MSISFFQFLMLVTCFFSLFCFKPSYLRTLLNKMNYFWKSKKIR